MPDDVEEFLAQRRYDEALERLLDRHEQQIYRMALLILRDAGLAEEATQEAFLKARRAFPRFDGRASVSTWLYTIARNTCLSALRRASRRRVTSLEDILEPAAPETPAADTELLRCVARLPESDRQVITLFYWEDRSVRDVARTLDLPEGTVKSQLHRARRALARMLEG
jgi:RNA polymerase sigma-70 factor (ECF subfamily)